MDSSDTKLTAQSYGVDVVTNFNKLRVNGDLCDFTICADGQKFQVHKALLAAMSDYFHVMFMGSLRESREDVIELKGLTGEAVGRIINFIYTGEVLINQDSLSEFLDAASHLQVHAALDVCTNYLNSLLTFDNADEILEIADTYSLTWVLSHFDDLVMKHFEEFGKTELFQNLKLDHLIKYISNNNLHVRCEKTLFKLVKQWLEEDDDRLSLVTQVAKHVRYALMTEEDIREISVDPFVQGNDSLRRLVISGLNYHSSSRNGGHMPLDELCQIRTPAECLVSVHPGSTYAPLKITAFHKQTEKFYFLCAETFCGNVNAQVAEMDNYIYIFRVLDYRNEGGVLKSSLCRFDPRHLSLQELTPNDRPRTETAMVAFDHKLYIIGGNYNFVLLDSVEVYSVETNSWSLIESLPFALHSHAATVANAKIYISGGWTALSRTPPSKRFICLDPVTETYKELPEMYNSRRLHCMITVGNQIYVFGGITTKGSMIPDIYIEAFNLATNQWTCLTSTLQGRSDGHFIPMNGTILTMGHEYIEAGEDEIWSYDPQLCKWEKVAKAPMKMNFTNAKCVLLKVNLNDKKIIGRILSR